MSRLMDVEVFVAVAEHGSFVSAAAALGVSSSYASKLVARLEERLGVRLIQRTTRRHTLTPQGQRYLAECQEALAQLKRAEEGLTDAAESVRGAIRVTAPTGIGLGALADAFNGFARAHPEVRLDVVYLDRKVDLIGERFDLAVRVGALPDSSLRARRVGAYPKRVVASPGRAQELAKVAHPDGLRGSPAVLYAGSERPNLWTLRSEAGEASISVEGRMQSNSGRALALAAADGLGIAYLPGFHTRDLEQAGRLVQLVPQWGQMVPVHVVFPSRRHLPVRVRVLIDHLVATFDAAGP